MKKNIPTQAEKFCTIIEPTANAIDDFEAWQQAQKAELEASGLVITEIEGTKFTGYRKSASDS